MTTLENTTTEAELFPPDLRIVPPARDDGLRPDDERLWFRRLAEARKQAAIHGPHSVWTNRVQSIRNLLCHANAGLVRAVLASCNVRSSDARYDDCCSEANAALLRCVDKFDTARGLKFSTPYWTCGGRAVRRMMKKIGRANRGRVYADDDANNFDPLKTTADPKAGLDRERAESAEAIALAMNAAGLSTRERRVVEGRFFTSPRLTLEELGNEFGLTKEMVRQCETAALAKLRREIETPGAASAERAEHRRHLLGIIDAAGLTSREYAVVRLTALIDPPLSHSEVAAKLGWKLTSVTGMASTARRKLNIAAEKAGRGPTPHAGAS